MKLHGYHFVHSDLTEMDVPSSLFLKCEDLIHGIIVNFSEVVVFVLLSWVRRISCNFVLKRERGYIIIVVVGCRRTSAEESGHLVGLMIIPPVII